MFCPYYSKVGHFMGLSGHGIFGVKLELSRPSWTVCMRLCRCTLERYTYWGLDYELRA